MAKIDYFLKILLFFAHFFVFFAKNHEKKGKNSENSCFFAHFFKKSRKNGKKWKKIEKMTNISIFQKKIERIYNFQEKNAF